eukprot:CAMPEP_0114137222 /NCGR_PEP_ID=MMETSP0043_2-20121206/15662_1 /TAXON_ID=464988 /ORGANISM="Hemiselmis andersenii, Strain CCMP644" /LENGTH=339 /DNA_ID=CAMNT_0001231087 /DNA_START=105 /DNA_END=1124 /DNA_ORIENTATION=+
MRATDPFCCRPGPSAGLAFLSALLLLLAVPAAPSSLPPKSAGPPSRAAYMPRLRGGSAPAPAPAPAAPAPPAATAPVAAAPPPVKKLKPLPDAAVNGDEETVVAHIKGGADVNAFFPTSVNMLEPNTFQLAAWGGHTKLVTTLLGLGAQVNAQNKRGYSALHFAAMMGHNATCATLISAGANLACCDMFGDRPLETAQHAGMEEVEGYLKAEMMIRGIAAPENDATAASAHMQQLLEDLQSCSTDPDFIPRHMLAPGGKELLPEYESMGRMILETKKLMEEGGAEPDYKKLSALIEEEDRKVTALRGRFEEHADAMERTGSPQGDEPDEPDEAELAAEG